MLIFVGACTSWPWLDLGWSWGDLRVHCRLMTPHWMLWPQLEAFSIYPLKQNLILTIPSQSLVTQTICSFPTSVTEMMFPPLPQQPGLYLSFGIHTSTLNRVIDPACKQDFDPVSRPTHVITVSWVWRNGGKSTKVDWAQDEAAFGDMEWG